MNKEEIIAVDELMASLDRTVIGAIDIDYPVYLVHLEYEKKNDDPMYFIDWAIANFVKSRPIVDKASISNILGMSVNLIDYRIKLMKQDGLLSEDKSGTLLTKAGEDLFLNNNDEIPYISSSSDFLIDGKSLTTMDPIFYSQKGYITFDKNSIYPRAILKGADDIPVKTLLNKLSKMTATNKQKVGLPAESRNFSSIDMPSQGILKVILVFSCDSQNICHKDLFYAGELVKIPAIAETVAKAYFYADMLFNYGYDNMEPRDLIHKAFNFNISDIKALLKYCFDWSEIEDSWYSYDKASIKRPLTVHVNMKNFASTPGGRRLRILDAIKNGYYEVHIHNHFEKFIRITVSTNDKELLKLLEFDKEIIRSQKEENLSNMDDIFKKYGVEYSRKGLIMLYRYDILERIDILNYVEEYE